MQMEDTAIMERHSQPDARNVRYSVVVPCYKSGPWLDALVARVGKVMESNTSALFELVLVNDCSPDTITWESIRNCARNYPWVRGFNLLYNVGQYRAILCGFEQAKGKFIVTMDDDLQHIPEELPKLINAIESNDDLLCVIAEYEHKEHSRFRNFGSAIHQRMMSRLYSRPKHIRTTSFRILRRELAQAVLSCRTAAPQITPLILSLTSKVVNVRVRHAPRKQGRSGYRLNTLIKISLENVINASTFPLRVFSLLGFFFSFASFVIATLYLVRWLSGGIRVAGFTTQILLITFFGGMSLAGIGILGEYIARIIRELTGPQKYFVRETTDLTPHGRSE